MPVSPPFAAAKPRAISELLQGRVKNIDFFQCSERRHKPDGSFNGAIAVSISPLADGPMAEVQADPRVVEVYLGE